MRDAIQRTSMVLSSNPLRQIFENKMQCAQDEVMLLGSMVEKGLIEMMDALRQRNLAKCTELLVNERKIRKQRAKIETEIMALLTTQHPVAVDLRALVSGLEIAGELERMGQYVDEIGQICCLMGKSEIRASSLVFQMANLVQAMLHDAMGAYGRRDAVMARQVPLWDEQVDACYRQVNQEFSSLDAGASQVEASLHLLRVAHNLERLGDRVTNVCEWVLYTISGTMIELG